MTRLMTSSETLPVYVTMAVLTMQYSLVYELIDRSVLFGHNGVTDRELGRKAVLQKKVCWFESEVVLTVERMMMMMIMDTTVLVVGVSPEPTSFGCRRPIVHRGPDRTTSAEAGDSHGANRWPLPLRLRLHRRLPLP